MDDLRKSLLLSAMASQRAQREAPLFVNGKKVKNLKYCHQLVRDTAKAFAGEIYEEVMHHNENWEAWQAMCPDLTKEKLQSEFIKLMWPRLLDDARATLAKMLAGPIAEPLKEQIYRALILDGQIRGKRGPKPIFRQ